MDGTNRREPGEESGGRGVGGGQRNGESSGSDQCIKPMWPPLLQVELYYLTLSRDQVYEEIDMTCELDTTKQIL